MRFWPQYLRLVLYVLAGSFIASLIAHKVGRPVRIAATNAVVLLVTLVIEVRRSHCPPEQFGFIRSRIISSLTLGLLAGVILSFWGCSILPEGAGLASAFFTEHSPLAIPVILFSWLFTPYGIAFLLVAVAEEMVFRGVMLRGGVNFFGRHTPAVLLTSLTFICLHYGYLQQGLWSSVLFLGAQQVFISFAYLRIGNIAFPIACHYAYNLFLVAIPSLAQQT